MAGGRRVVPVKGVGSGASGRAFLYVLPCLLMSAMCMKGMAGKKPDEAH